MITTSDLVNTALHAVRGNPLRSALTALGVIIGVASVIAMVAIGTGAQSKIEASISSLGSNLLVISPGSQRGPGNVFIPGQGNNLTLGDATAISKQVPEIEAVAPMQRSRAQLNYEGTNWQTEINGVTPAFQTARDMTLSAGRFIDERDVRQARKVMVLGATVVENLFPNIDPIGQSVRLPSGPYEVIGVLEKKGQSGFGQDQDDVAIAPFTTVKRRLSGRWGRPDRVSQILVTTTSEDAVARAEEEITSLLRQRHRIDPGADLDFRIANLNSISEASREATQIFTYLLSAIAGVSLLVGGIGIMNIMLVSVTERTREIGLRKALGARRRDILAQFGVESVVLSLGGGLIGLVLGIGLAAILTKLMQLPFIINIASVMLALSVSAGVGVIFGAYPAWRAGSLDPITALRRE